jgi:CO/xanthine dehydrogenase FAD-binding subunit
MLGSLIGPVVLALARLSTHVYLIHGRTVRSRTRFSPVKPPAFEYARPESVADTVALLASEGERAKVLAGGQSLVALMNLRLAAPELVVDIGRLDELRYVRRNGVLRIGALTTQRTIEKDDSIARSCPLLAEAVGHIAHAAIRNRGTVGGSIAHADPAAELPLVMLALGGEATVASAAGTRQVSADDFFRGFLMTAIEPHELLTEVSLPLARENEGFAFEEFARRPGDFGLVSVACRVTREGDGVASARVVLGGMGAAPVVLEGLDALGDGSPDEAAEAAGAATEALEPAADIHASLAYRVHLARELTKRAVRRAAGGGA